MLTRHYTTLAPNLRRNISALTKPSGYAEKHIKHRKLKLALVWGVALAFYWPIFRSGLKSNLTLIEFIVNHTVFGDPVEFIPKEDYMQELS